MNSINEFQEQIAKEVKTVMRQLCADHGKRYEVVIKHCYIVVSNTEQINIYTYNTILCTMIIHTGTSL